MGDERMQFTDLGSYRRIWRWMGECGDTHQQAGEVLFSTPNMLWPGQVARPGDWIVRTPTGFVAEPGEPEDAIDVEGWIERCKTAEARLARVNILVGAVYGYIKPFEDRLSTTEAALADAKAEIERMKAACHHGSQTLEGEGMLRCELCGAVERDPFWRNPA